ncbi:MAG: hypothetical protein WDZ52_01905 [Pseudohongiellaceae bacterium]
MHSNRFKFLQLTAALLCSLLSIALYAQPLANVTGQECVRGDCIEGSGRLELATQWGKGEYTGNFREGQFHGFGRLEVPISFTAREVYDGDWDMGRRSGRGTHWNGEGKLYIGQWRDDKRNGHGSYFFGLSEWHENQHSEYWLKENIENYTGDFVDDFYHGQGTFRWAGGQKYVGGFFANEKHGPGTYYYVTGVARQQVWEYGNFLR